VRLWTQSQGTWSSMVIGCPETMKSFQLARLFAVEGGTDKVYSFQSRRRKRGLQFAEILNDIILHLKAMVGIVIETREMNHPLPGIRHSVVFVWIFSSQNQGDIIESGCGTRQVMPDEGQRKVEANAHCALFRSISTWEPAALLPRCVLGFCTLVSMDCNSSHHKTFVETCLYNELCSMNAQ
jgi:hypothetical protein